MVKVGDDMFVGDDVRERWNNGQKTRAVTDVVWNVGSLFIPGYDVAKAVGKVSKLGKIGKIAEELAEAAADAGDAARRVRKAAEIGDVDGVRKAAKEADEAADEAEDAARKTGCAIAFGPRVRYGGTGVAGSGTGVLAADPRTGWSSPTAAATKRPRPRRRRPASRNGPPTWNRSGPRSPSVRARPSWTRRSIPSPSTATPPTRATTTTPTGPRTWSPRSWATATGPAATEPQAQLEERVPAPLPGADHRHRARQGIRRPAPHGGQAGRGVRRLGLQPQTFLEAKNGYDSYLSKTDKGTLTESGKQKFLTGAKAQVEASSGRAVERHFSDPDVAKAARIAFREEGLPIKVVPTPQKPAGGPRKPEVFD